jgi:hypothetical protein
LLSVRQNSIKELGMGRSGTDFLFSKMTALTGLGTIWNLAGNFYCFNVSASEKEADARAIQSDWLMTGQDLRDAIAGATNSPKQLELQLR